MAAISDVKIVNMALANLGKSSVIENLDELIPEAKQGKLWYDPSRRQVLEAFDWAFARKRVALSLHAEASPIQWQYRYRYPSDCVKLRRLPSPVGWPAHDLPFSIEMASTGTERTILTDAPEAVAVYTFDQTFTHFFSPLFILALSYLLAANMAVAITGDRDVKDKMIAAYDRVLMSAMGSNAQEEVERGPAEAPWISARN